MTTTAESGVPQLQWIRTPRLWLRPLSHDDLAAVDALNRQPGVMRFLGTTAPLTAEVAARIGAAIDRFRPGLQRCAVLLDDATRPGPFIGWCGVELSAYSERGASSVELGYRLRPEAWGRGLATEAASALVDRAFLVGGVDEVFARTMTVNEGSRAVMRKLGMQHVRTYHEAQDDPVPGTEHGEVRYSLSRHDWQLRRRDPREQLHAAREDATARGDEQAGAAIDRVLAAIATDKASPTGSVSGSVVAGAPHVWLSDARVRQLVQDHHDRLPPGEQAARSSLQAVLDAVTPK